MFHKIGNARGWMASKLGVFTFIEKHLWDRIILAKMQGDLYLYSLAPHELIASIQNIKAIGDESVRYMTLSWL